MTTINVAYLGGHPKHKKSMEDVRLVLDGGTLTLRRDSMQDMIRQTVTVFAIALDEITTASEAGNKKRRKGAGRAFLIAGPAGVAAHAATKGRQTYPLAISAEQDGEAFTCQFVGKKPEIERMLRILAEERGVAVEPVEAASGDDPLAQLERVAALHASGVLSDEEFEAKKAELLDRV